MAKTKNKIVGHIACPFCLSRADVRENSGGNKYMACPVDGPFNSVGRGYRDWIDDHYTPLAAIPAETPAEPEQEKPAAAGKVTAEIPAVSQGKPRRSGLLIGGVIHD